MPPVFSPRANLIARASVLAVATSIAGVIASWIGFSGSAYDTGSPLGWWQPIPFSHAHHAGELGIDCRYCHASVETSAHAGMPATDVCANCHWQLWTDAAMLEPVRASWREGTRLRWNRVYDTPDYVYFDHSVHVTAGVSCAVCHGAVDRMPIVERTVAHTMGWCLDCHEQPHERLDERALLAAGSAAPPSGIRTEGLTSCSACHR